MTTITNDSELRALERVEAVIEFERAIAEFSRVILAGDTEYVTTMTAFVDNLTGCAS